MAQSPHPLAPEAFIPPHPLLPTLLRPFVTHSLKFLVLPLHQPRVSSLPPKFQTLFLQLSRVLLPPLTSSGPSLFFRRVPATHRHGPRPGLRLPRAYPTRARACRAPPPGSLSPRPAAWRWPRRAAPSRGTRCSAAARRGRPGRSGSAAAEGRLRLRSFSRSRPRSRAPAGSRSRSRPPPGPGPLAAAAAPGAGAPAPVRGGQRPWPNPPTQQKPRRPRPLSGAHPPGYTRHPGDRRRSSGVLCAPRVRCRVPPDAPRASGPRHPTSQTLEPGAHVGRRRPGPGCTTLYPFLAIQVIFTPGSPLGPQSPAPFLLPPLKPPPGPAMEARRGPGVRDWVPGSAPAPARLPDAPFALPRLSPPTSPRQLPGSFVALARLALWNARASPSQARPPPHHTAGGGTGRGREEEGRDARKEELELQCPGSLERPRPGGSGDLAAASGHKMGGNRKSWPVIATDSAGILTGLRIVQLGRLQRVDSSGLCGRDKGCLKSAEPSTASRRSRPAPQSASLFCFWLDLSACSRAPWRRPPFVQVLPARDLCER